MSLRINNNIQAANGYRNLTKNDHSLGQSLERLSSGMKINRASDDAAGLVISEQMRAQLTGLDQGIKNSETAVNMVQTAEGSLDEMNTLLKKVRSLALHGANTAPNDTNQLIADQAELDNAVKSITRISQTTQFGTKKLLDGTLAAANSFDTNKVYKFDVGTQLLARSDFNAGQVCLVIDSSAESSTNVRYSTAALATVVGTSTVVVSQATVLNGYSASDFFNGNSIGSFFASGTTNGTVGGGSTQVFVARVEDTTYSLATGTSASTINGSNVVSWLNTTQSVYTFTQDASALVVVRNSTGAVGATRDVEFGLRVTSISTTDGCYATKSFTLDLFNAASLQSYGHNQATTIRTSGAGTFSGFSVAGGSLGDTATVFVNGNGSTLAGSTLRETLGVADTRLNSGAQMILSVAGKDYTFANGETIGDMVSNINAQQDDYYVDTDRDRGLTLVRRNIGNGGAATDLAISVRDAQGRSSYMTPLSTNKVELSGTGAASVLGGIDDGVNILAHLEGSGLPGGRLNLVTTSDDASVLRNNGNGIAISLDTAFAKTSGSVTANLTTGALFQTGPNNNQQVGVDIKDVGATKLGLGGDKSKTLTSLQSLVDKQSLVNGMFTETLDVIDKAIDDVTNLRGSLGAFQANTLETGLNSLRVTSENLTGAESTIRDTDFAAESVNFAKQQILTQASNAMLAQANQLPNSVLQLIGR
ncbi:flagellin [Planctomycetota bacterium]|nr:flagellin [Planctomycetota bacterium]